jgi:iron(III) transport system permease protein
LLLLLPAVLSFVLDQGLQRRQQAQLSAKSQPLQALRGWPARLLALGFAA